MGSFLNPGNVLFFEDVNSEIYVDKTPLIDVVNKKIRTKQKCMCVSRPRRFGKTMAMNMRHHTQSISTSIMLSG